MSEFLNVRPCISSLIAMRQKICMYVIYVSFTFDTKLKNIDTYIQENVWLYHP